MNKLTGHIKQFMWSMGFLLIVFLAGCGGGDGTSTQPGVLAVSLTDAPACGFDQVNVTVSKVRVHQSSSANENAGGWTDITLDPPRRINLLNLNDPTQPNFALESLGETPLSAGHYTQLRLVLVPNGNNPTPPFSNSVVLSGTTSEIALSTPSAIRSGIKLIHQFNVASGQRVDLLLDFDACHSIVTTGNGMRILKPVIKVIPFELNGIEGFVDTALLSSHVVVSAQVNGEVVRATMPNANPLPNPNLGKFFLARLTPGVLYDVVFTADNHATAVVTGVPVPSSTSTTIISTDNARIGLDTSPTGIINGTVTLNPATDDETVVVKAKQSFSSGPTVTIQSQNASVVDSTPPGDFTYNMTLPVGAPSLGEYNTPLPIMLSAQAGVADIYTVQGAATGYVTQSVSPISTGSSHNFTLIP